MCDTSSAVISGDATTPRSLDNRKEIEMYNASEISPILISKLEDAINQIEMYLASTKSFLEDDNYLQAAVRLEMAGEVCKFTEFEIKIFEACSPRG